MAPLKISSSNWMAGIPDRTRLFDLYIPGSHDAATGYFSRRDYSSDINTLPAQAVMTQDKNASYEVQLENGIRYFDLRFRKEGSSADQYQLYHKYFLQTNLSEAIESAKNFLEKNPTEAVFISLQPDDDSIVRPEDIRDNIFSTYKRNGSLPSYNELGLSFYNGARPDNLWIEGYRDFDTIRQLRPFKGLGNLGANFSLTTGDYSDNQQIDDPKKSAGTVRNPKLDYSGLALGDVRGKIILVESLFTGYSGYGWDQPGLGVDPLDVQGAYSTGTVEQNNYEAPGYQEKKNDIYNFAVKSDYTKPGSERLDRALPLNYSSAAPTGWTFLPGYMPSSYALTINSGSTKNDYKTDTTESLASRFNINILDKNADNGHLRNWNIQKKLLQTGTGLKGVMLGDFYTTSYAWYDKFWNSWWHGRDGTRPNVNSGDYPSSDWLTQKIWRQSAIVTPTIGPASSAKDSLTGLPVIKEGETFYLSWNDYAGFTNPGTLNSDLKINDGTQDWTLKYKVTQVNAVEHLGISSTDSRQKGLSSPTLFIKEPSQSGLRSFRRAGGSPKFQFDGTGSQIQKGFDYISDSVGFLETFTIGQSAGAQGDRFFKVDLMSSPNGINWYPTGVPTYFMVTDA